MHKWLSHALKGGAGPAHRWCAKEDALPDLPLVISDSQGVFTADPQCVAELYAQEWERERGCDDACSFEQEIRSNRALREAHVGDAGEWAYELDLSAENIRKACLSFPSKTSIGLDQHSFQDIAHLSDNAPNSLGDIVRQCFANFTIPTQPLLQFIVLLGKKNGRSRTIAILHTTYRLTMRLISAHISQRDVNFAGKWDSALKGNSPLRAAAACAAGIELAHREGRYVIHFLWEVRKFYYSIKAHLLIPQLVARGNPIEILALEILTHKSPRCLQVGYGCSDVITGCASSISTGCLQRCSWARCLLFDLIQSLGTRSLGRFVKNTSMICHSLRRAQAAFNSCTMQSNLTKKSLSAGTASLGRTLSCKSTLLANDKSLEKLIVDHLAADGVLICQGTAATDLGIETAAGKKMRIPPMDTHLERKAKSEESPSFVQDEPCCTKPHDDGRPSCSS